MRIFLLLAIQSLGLAQVQYYIDTFAGYGRLSSSDDGAYARDIRLVRPSGLTFDGNGNLFLIDDYYQRVFRIAADGTTTVFAGSGEEGLSGDGGLAVNAALRNPLGLAVNANGELFIADASNTRIRKIALDGTISTVAGTFSLSSTGDGGPATAAAIGNPAGIAFDAAGNLYFSDAFNHVVRRIDTSGMISTYAGNGTIGFSGDGGLATEAQLQRPLGLAFDSVGNLYIADSQNHRIRCVAPDGTITTVAGSASSGFSGDNGAATSARLLFPSDVKVDANDALLIADSSNGRVRRVADGIITTIGGGGPVDQEIGVATAVNLSAMSWLAMDQQGHLLFAETARRRVRSVGLADGGISVVAGAPWTDAPGDNGPAKMGGLLDPVGVAVDANGNVYVSDQVDNRVRRIDGSGTITTLTGNGSFSTTGDGGPGIQASVAQPRSLAVDSGGDVYVATASRVRRITAAGTISTYAGGNSNGFGGDNGPAINAQLSFPSGLAFDSNDNLFIADTSNHRIREVMRDSGVIVTVAGNGTPGFFGDGEAATASNLTSPSGVAVDQAGNLYIADTGNQRVRMVGLDGIITTVAGDGTARIGPDGGLATASGLIGPAGVAVDMSGNLFITHGGNAQVRMVSPSGIISTIAGTPVIGFSGDGGPATSGQLNFPKQLALTPGGLLFVADELNQRVRVLTPAGSGAQP
ncbi:MAG TPA: hypothetical protein VEV17_07695 [Bryobacteraceae bacterium]|nr:hypothetical protein [Bryobacteraceae bacterium]